MYPPDLKTPFFERHLLAPKAQEELLNLIEDNFGGPRAKTELALGFLKRAFREYYEMQRSQGRVKDSLPEDINNEVVLLGAFELIQCQIRFMKADCDWEEFDALQNSLMLRAEEKYEMAPISKLLDDPQGFTVDHYRDVQNFCVHNFYAKISGQLITSEYEYLAISVAREVLCELITPGSDSLPPMLVDRT
jgi:hypothetical protein